MAGRPIPCLWLTGRQPRIVESNRVFGRSSDSERPSLAIPCHLPVAEEDLSPSGEGEEPLLQQDRPRAGRLVVWLRWLHPLLGCHHHETDHVEEAAVHLGERLLDHQRRVPGVRGGQQGQHRLAGLAYPPVREVDREPEVGLRGAQRLLQGQPSHHRHWHRSDPLLGSSS